MRGERAVRERHGGDDEVEVRVVGDAKAEAEHRFVWVGMDRGVSALNGRSA